MVVTGEGRAFCAGADLSDLGSSEREGLLAIYEGFLRVAHCPLPTIAAVNGAAVGAGMNLALACDVRLAARRARFDTRFLQLGLHPGGGHTWMFRRIAGPQVAAAALLFGEVLDGAEAERAGLVWRCVDDDDLLTTAHELAARAAAAPRDLVVKVKETLGSHGRGRHPRGGGGARARPPGVVAPPARLRRAPRRPPGEDHQQVAAPAAGTPQPAVLTLQDPTSPPQVRLSTRHLPNLRC